MDAKTKAQLLATNPKQGSSRQEGAGITVTGEACKDAGVYVTCEDVSGYLDVAVACEVDVFVTVHEHSQVACLL